MPCLPRKLRLPKKQRPSPVLTMFRIALPSG